MFQWNKYYNLNLLNELPGVIDPHDFDMRNFGLKEIIIALKINTLVRRVIWPFIVFHKLILSKRSHLRTIGWIESIKLNGPYKSDGAEIPWMNYQVISFLEERLSGDLSLFEFGSGFSTRYWARFVCDVTSLEYDKDWYAAVKEKIPENVSLIFQEKDVDGEYCRSIIKTKRLYDIVVVDGRDRINCVTQSIHALSERGVIILDDSQREKYREAILYAQKNGFRVLEFEGLKPTEFRTRRTTIFYKDGNCLGI